MAQKVMICGRDCTPENGLCNNYCNADPSKPMPDSPPEATQEQKINTARRIAYEKLQEAEKAWHEYFALCELGPERIMAAEVFDNVRNAARVGA